MCVYVFRSSYFTSIYKYFANLLTNAFMCSLKVIFFLYYNSKVFAIFRVNFSIYFNFKTVCCIFAAYHNSWFFLAPHQNERTTNLTSPERCGAVCVPTVDHTQRQEERYFILTLKTPSTSFSLEMKTMFSSYLKIDKDILFTFWCNRISNKIYRRTCR